MATFRYTSVPLRTQSSWMQTAPLVSRTSPHSPVFSSVSITPPMSRIRSACATTSRTSGGRDEAAEYIPMNCGRDSSSTPLSLGVSITGRFAARMKSAALPATP